MFIVDFWGKRVKDEERRREERREGLVRLNRVDKIM